MISDYQPSQGTLRRLAIKGCYAPAPLVDPELQEIGPLKEVEKQLAQKFGMASPQGIDSISILQEARRRAKLPWRRFHSPVLAFFRKVNAKASNSDGEKKLHRLYHLRLKYGSNPQWQSIPCESPICRRPHATFTHLDFGQFSLASMHMSLMSEHRIQCLLGSRNSSHGDPLTPSRTNIVKILHGLIDNPEIERGDNIVIYYAGHGSSYHCSEHFSTALESKSCSIDVCPIEALCPIDRDTIDADGHPIPDISDRELNALFTEISRVKGHKITFIADCCHAGGMSRDPNPEVGIRSTRATLHCNVNDMLRAANEHYRSVLSKNWRPDISSHVILAACRDYQCAKETLGKEGYGGVLNSASF